MVDTLVVLVPGPVVIRDGMIRTAGKTLSGLESFARRWPGDVVYVTEVTTPNAPEHLGTVARSIADLPFRVLGTGDRLRAIEAIKPAVVLANLAMSEVPVIKGVRAPVVLNVENDFRNRLTWARIEGGAGMSPRVVAGLLKLEAHYLALIRRAAGVQFNGWPAWSTYHRHNRKPLLTFDSRISREQLVTPEAKTEMRRSSREFSFAFSGRWLKQKGFNEALEAHRRVRSRGESIRLHVFGAGPLALPDNVDASVTVHGAVDFEKEWLARVTADVDAMLLPYPQSDPAGTYLEGISCGAPIVAFDNHQASYLADQGLGWTVPVSRVDDLADLMVRVARDGTALRVAREKGFAFMQEHSMEREFERRTQHLVDCAAL